MAISKKEMEILNELLRLIRSGIISPENEGEPEINGRERTERKEKKRI
jgi:hypothetical protein